MKVWYPAPELGWAPCKTMVWAHSRENKKKTWSPCGQQAVQVSNVSLQQKCQPHPGLRSQECSQRAEGRESLVCCLMKRGGGGGGRLSIEGHSDRTRDNRQKRERGKYELNIRIYLFIYCHREGQILEQVAREDIFFMSWLPYTPQLILMYPLSLQNTSASSFWNFNMEWSILLSLAAL